MISGLNYLVTPAEITAEIEHAGLRVLAQHDVARPQVLTGTRPTTKLMLEASL